MSVNNGSAHTIIYREEDSWRRIFKDGLVAVRDILIALVVAFLRLIVSAPRKSVQDEIVLVTGAGRGIGQQLALEFSKLGAILIIWDIDEDANQQTAKLIEDAGGKVYSYTCDVGNRAAVYRVAALVKAEVGTVNILVNNAGIVTGKKFLDCSDDEINHTFRVNLFAYFWMVKCFLPAMLEQNHGHVVNMASSCGLLGLSKLVDYSSSKFGVVGLSEVLHYEIAFSGQVGVHTTVVCPSYVKTGMFEGCKMRFRWILPELELKPTVDRIMQGILTNQIQIYIPRMVYFFTCLKTMFPVEALLVIMRFFGASTFMESFIGRVKKMK